MSDRDARLLRTLLGVRDPLSRIELALERGAIAPVAGALVLEIRAAVAEADARLEAALRSLRNVAGAEHEDDCRGSVAELAERLRAPLAARGVGFELATSDEAVPGDPTLLRRALLCLLRTAADWAGPRGSIRVRLQTEPQRTGLHALVSAPHGAASDGFADEALERFALASGGAFALERSAPGAVSLALWLPERTEA